MIGLLVTIDPFHDTVHVKAVRALTPHERTVVTGIFAVRAAGIERHSTNTAIVIIGDPFPNSYAGIAMLVDMK